MIEVPFFFEIFSDLVSVYHGILAINTLLLVIIPEDVTNKQEK